MENIEQSQPVSEKPTAPEITNPSTPVVRLQKSSILLPILLSLLMFLLGGALVFAYFVFIKPAKVVPQPTVSPSPFLSPAPTPSIEDQTADWKVYRNEDYWFEIKYPPELEIDFEHRGFLSGSDYYGTRDFNFLITNPELEPSVRVYASDVPEKDVYQYDGYNFAVFSGEAADKHVKNLQDLIESDQSTHKESSLRIAGKDYKLHSISLSDPSWPSPYSFTYFQGGSYTFIAGGGYEQETFKKILSTFKFTEEEQTADCSKLERLEMQELTQISESECQKCGGKWGVLSMDLNMTGCNPKTSDAGKSCTNYDQCVGICLAKDESSVSGTCSEYKFSLGCTLEFSDGQPVMLCRD